jgi:hypothetical protein
MMQHQDGKMINFSTLITGKKAASLLLESELFQKSLHKKGLRLDLVYLDMFTT